MTVENLIMEKSVTILSVDNRTLNAFEREGICTIGELVSLDAHDLLDIRGFGQNCLIQTTSALSEWGLTLKPSGFTNRR